MLVSRNVGNRTEKKEGKGIVEKKREKGIGEKDGNRGSERRTGKVREKDEKRI